MMSPSLVHRYHHPPCSVKAQNFGSSCWPNWWMQRMPLTRQRSLHDLRWVESHNDYFMYLQIYHTNYDSFLISMNMCTPSLMNDQFWTKIQFAAVSLVRRHYIIILYYCICMKITNKYLLFYLLSSNLMNNSMYHTAVCPCLTRSLPITVPYPSLTALLAGWRAPIQVPGLPGPAKLGPRHSQVREAREHWAGQPLHWHGAQGHQCKGAQPGQRSRTASCQQQQ